MQLLAALLLIFSLSAQASENLPDRVSLGVGARLEFLPIHLIESEAPHVPSLTALLRMDLPASFSANMRYVGVVIKNQLELGLGWSTTAFGLPVSLQYFGGVRFGALEGSGFNASTWSWVHHPGIQFSVPWQDSWIMLQTELILGGTEHFKLGEFTDSSKLKTPFQGFQVNLLVESPLGEGARFYYGAGVIVSVPYDQAWLVFSDENEKATYPQLMVGYEFL